MSLVTTFLAVHIYTFPFLPRAVRSTASWNRLIYPRFRRGATFPGPLTPTPQSGSTAFPLEQRRLRDIESAASLRLHRTVPAPAMLARPPSPVCRLGVG